MAIYLWRLDISCDCFSSSAAGKISYATLIRAIVIMVLSAAAYAAVILLQPKGGSSPAMQDEPGTDEQPDGLGDGLMLAKE